MKPQQSVLERAFESALRNWVTTVPTVLVIAIVLTMFHGLLMVHDRAVTTLRSIQDKFSIVVYLKDDASPSDVGNLITALKERKDVTQPVVYTSKEEAWNLVSKSFSLDTELLKKYALSLPASISITPRQLEDTPIIEAYIETNYRNILKESLTAQDKQRKLTSQMVGFVQNVRVSTLRTLIFFIVIFIVGGTMLMSSTIHLAITTRHREIGIMKLVGASHSTITTPFVFEGVLIAVVAFVLHLFLLVLLPIGITATTLHFNALILEAVATIGLGIGVSYSTTMLHIKKKIFL